ncbi:hypothetical protein BH11PLA1_BH11PLA1_12130 [soil metagenome]
MRLVTLLAFAGLAASSSSLLAQPLSFTGTNLTQNFDALPTTGTLPLFPANTAVGAQVNVPGITGWQAAKVAGTGTSALVLTANDGSGNSGTLYSYGVGAAADRALGLVASGSYTGAFGVAIQNNSSSAITSFTITFDGEIYRSSTSAQNRLVFAVGSTGASASDFLTSAALTANPAADIVGPAPVGSNGVITPTATGVATTISGVNIAVGDILYLRWTDTNDAGNDAGLAIDNFTFTTAAVAIPASIAKTVTASPLTVGTLPGNVTYTFTGVSNTGGLAATGATITAAVPAGITLVSTTFPTPASVTLTGGTLTINLGNVAPGAAVPDFNVVLRSTVEFTPAAPLNITFNSAPGTDSDPTSVVIFNNTNTIQQNDIILGENSSDADVSLRLYRPSTSAFIPDSYPLSFIESVEFDNKNALKSNPLGNLLGVNFGTTASGGLVYAFPTQHLGTTDFTLLGSFTDANTFTHGATTSSVPLDRLGGLSVSFCNDKIALTGYLTGAFYVFDYANTGDGLGSLSNGRALNDGISNSAPSKSVGTTWIDNTHFVAASVGASNLLVTVFEVSSTAITQVSQITVPGAFSFTDAEFQPGAPAPLNDKLIVVGSNFVASVNTNTAYVFQVPVGPGYAIAAPIITADYSVSIPNSSREIALTSTGDLRVGYFGSAVATIPYNASLATMFSGTNGTVLITNNAPSFNGLDVAAGTALPSCAVAPTRCQPADIADDAGNPLPSAGPNNGVNEGDYNAFFNNFFTNQAVGSPADIADDAGNPLPPFNITPPGPNSGVNEGDYNAFFNNFFNGCPA